MQNSIELTEEEIALILKRRVEIAEGKEKRPVTYLDQIDADRAAIEFLKERAVLIVDAPTEIRWNNHESDGRTGSLWSRGKLVAITVVLRDDFNRSVLVVRDLISGASMPSSVINEPDNQE